MPFALANRARCTSTSLGSLAASAPLSPMPPPVTIVALLFFKGFAAAFAFALALAERVEMIKGVEGS